MEAPSAQIRSPPIAEKRGMLSPIRLERRSLSWSAINRIAVTVWDRGGIAVRDRGGDRGDISRKSARLAHRSRRASLTGARTGGGTHGPPCPARHSRIALSRHAARQPSRDDL